jgi:hypothetical protein
MAIRPLDHSEIIELQHEAAEHIGEGDKEFWGVLLAEGMDTAEVVLALCAQATYGPHSPVPALTPEEVAVAEAERELEQARADGVIANYIIAAPSVSDPLWQYALAPSDDKSVCEGATRLAAAQAAAARVRELRAAQEAEEKRKRLPEPEEMDFEGVRRELIETHGLALQWGAMAYRPAISGEKLTKCCGVMKDDETLLEFARRALREARELDGAHTT